MRYQNTEHRLGKLSVGLGLAIFFGASSGTAEKLRGKYRNTCVASYEHAQEFRRESRLRLAREELLVCAQSSCGKLIRAECKTWLKQVSGDMSRVTFVFKDGSGRALADVVVDADGAPLPLRGESHEAFLEPGEHLLSFTSAADGAASRKIVLGKAEKNHTVEVTLQKARGPEANVPAAPPVAQSTEQAALSAEALSGISPKVMLAEPSTTASVPIVPVTQGATSSDAPAEPRRPLLLPGVLGGAGVLGVGGFVALALLAEGRKRQIADCWPDCSQSTVDRARNLYIAADVSLGVGLVAIGTATWLMLRPTQASVGSNTKAPGLAFDVDTTPGRMSAQVRGAF